MRSSSTYWADIEADRKGFTLIELLVVIGIIAVLMGILLPSVNKLMLKAEINRAKTDVQRIANAWQAYYSEYKRWPVENGYLFRGLAGAPNAAEGTTGMVMSALIMTNIMYPFASLQETGLRNTHPIVTNFNPRGLTFMTYDTDSVDTNGYLVDPWNTPYWFLFDINGDGKVTRGGPSPTTVYGSVIVWSLGPDKVLSDDDICSWDL